MSKVYDVSMPIYEGMPVYKNKEEKQPKFETVTNGYVTETRVSLDVHTGTHIDSPLHMVINGEKMESIPIQDLVRECRVVDMMNVEDGITAADLEHTNVQEGEFLLFKTRNSNEDTFNAEFIYVKEDAARYLVDRKVKGVGIDALGVERSQPGHPTHKTLFSHEVVVIEGLRLKDVPEGTYLMVAAPIRLMGLDAAPARVVLIEQ